MLLKRLPVYLLTGSILIVGCSRDQSDYRPLTETAADDPAATAMPAKAEKSATGRAEPTKSDAIAKPSTSPESPADAVSGSASASTPLSQAPSAASAVMPKPDVSREPAKEDSKSSPAESTTASDGEKNLAPGGARGMRGALASATPAKPLEIKLLIPEKEFTREGTDQALRVTFDDLDLLKVCNMEPVPPDVMDYLPDWLKNLNGQKIILRGWMFPSGRQEGISSFMFVRDNGICCFGRDPKVYDKLAVTMQPGKTTHYIAGRPFDVEATLWIEPDIEGPEEGLWWLYRLENARVIDQ